MVENTPPSPAEEEKPVNPWLTIWFKPRKTVRYLLDSEPGRNAVLLSMIYGAFQAAIQAVQSHTPQTAKIISETARIQMAVPMGAMAGLIGIYLAGWYYKVIGNLWGGKGDGLDVRTAIAWAQLPNLAVYGIWLVGFLGAKWGWGFSFSQNFQLVHFAGLVVFSIWSLVLMSQALGEAHQFSSWQGLLTMVIGVGIIVVPLIVLVMNLPGAKQAFKPHELFKEQRAVIKRLHFPSQISFKKPTLPASGSPGQPSAAFQVDYPSLIQSGKRVKLSLRDGRVIDARILEEAGREVFVDTPSGMVNMRKSEILKVEESKA